ncbi:TetR family transcriptional regulator [Xylophilus rhododendri]|uniref:TetR family transcriptional regulator n=1 Tax=Xylophilus rhododendri TaxID=2697032 RepID=A0A857J7A5_9BURK|nr:TetR family transcriptional regulator [Xylophilus rhododendri]QHI99123.1 TetR family transcriptional regulator [Xylophilus rhododendri]
MVRRTKEAAQHTRSQLLDAAEQLFHAQGVSRTSLQEIAAAAGTTRGAIYWHFKDKADLFNAMMERVTLPMEETIQHLGENPRADPVAELRESVRAALLLVRDDLQVRRVFEIATHQVEYVEELKAVKERHLQCRNDCLVKIERGLNQAAAQQKQGLSLPAPVAVHGLHGLVDGLIQNWLLDVQAFDLVEYGCRSVDVYLRGLGLMPDLRSLPEPAEALAEVLVE